MGVASCNIMNILNIVTTFSVFNILQLTTLATAFYMMLSKHFENAEFLRQIRMIGFLAQFESLLSSVGKLMLLY